MRDKCSLEGYQTVHSHCDKFESLRVCMEHTKSELQKQVRLQQQVLDVQVKQLDKMPTTLLTLLLTKESDLTVRFLCKPKDSFGFI